MADTRPLFRRTFTVLAFIGFGLALGLIALDALARKASGTGLFMGVME